MRWIPVALFTCLACSGSSIVGSKYVKTKAISASQGGILSVAQSDDPTLAGLQIQVSANALASDTTLTVAEAAQLTASQLGGDTQTGPTAELGPNGTHFGIPAMITLPFQASTDPEVTVIGVEADGTVFTLSDSVVSIDAQASLITFPADGFTKFAAVHHHAEEVCSSGETLCSSGGNGGGDGGTCTDLQTDNANCGACGTICVSGDTCTLGICTGNIDAGSCFAINTTSLDFGDVGQSDGGFCTSGSQSFTIIDSCAAVVTLESFSIRSTSGDATPQFTVPVGPVLPVGIEPNTAGVTFEMFFDPSSLGSHTAELVISNGTVDTQLPLSGTGVSSDTCGAPADGGEATDGGNAIDAGDATDGGELATCIAVTPTSITFDDVGVDDAGAPCTSGPKTFSITNSCDVSVTVQAMSIESGAGDFIPQFSLPEGPALPVVIQPGPTPLVYEMFFEPTSLGAHAGNLVISDGTVDTRVPLSGTASANALCL